MPRNRSHTPPRQATHTVPSGMGAVFNVRILSTLADDRPLAEVVMRDDFNGEQSRPLRSDLSPL